MSVLILGGTTEASQLARLVADTGFPATLSLAGLTSAPSPQPIPVRTGGFGGVDGLAAYLTQHRIEWLIDATHPFAVRMTRNAAAAASRTGTAFIALVRPEWPMQPGWRIVPDMVAAAAALGPTPRRVFLTVGQKELAPFIAAPQHHYLVRSVERPEVLPEGAEIITARGPFAEPDELALLRQHRIEVLVSKNSGGRATRPKLDAAQSLGIDIVMVERPKLPEGIPVVRSAQAALAWLLFHAGTRRGE